MADNRPPTDYRDEIDRRIEAALDSPSGARFPTARATIRESDDRWYGRLLIRSHASVTGSIAPEVLSAAASVELLREYCRLRNELIAELGDGAGHPASDELTAPLLAGDFLQSVAYSVFEGTDHAAAQSGFEALADLSERLVEVIDLDCTQSPPTVDRRVLTADAAGVLGEYAALLGALLADVDPAHRDRFATLGRELGTARRIGRTLDPEPGRGRAIPGDTDGDTPRRRATQRLDEARRALGDLSTVADVDALSPLFEDVELREA